MNLKIADMFSFTGVFFGFFSVLLVLNANFLGASVLLLLAALVDVIDGKMARFMKQENGFGKNIDSLCDIVSFGLAPALFFSAMLPGYLKFIPFLLILGGAYRLARFNVSRTRGYFVGMPITFNGVIIPVMYLLSLTDARIIVAVCIVVFVLMVSRIKIKKFV